MSFENMEWGLGKAPGCKTKPGFPNMTMETSMDCPCEPVGTHNDNSEGYYSHQSMYKTVKSKGRGVKHVIEAVSLSSNNFVNKSSLDRSFKNAKLKNRQYFQKLLMSFFNNSDIFKNC